MSVVIAAARGAYGRTVNVSRIGHEADLADRSHPLDRRELVEHVHCLHRHGEADPVAEARGEAVRRAWPCRA